MSRQRSLMERVRHWMSWGLHGAMTCEEFEAGLVDYLDGTLRPVDRHRINLHTRLCSHCRRYLRAYDKARRLAGDTIRYSDEQALMSVPEDLVQAILSARRGDSADAGR
ncbi:zf-HC2 domain-containing protein [Thalassobaculum sp.]|uniref:anti-sigma factor family protein n=1 Tax=Thalassobaculum sp. TaxID=2022740 RepID=UPI0032EE17B5